mmetsp:Transcript_13000/g.28113  ORF Transcript_13000/g.28113 Transcript_13000/m.28113 type:complete len:706 (+) Transcript_13000:69-2186(+)
MSGSESGGGREGQSGRSQGGGGSIADAPSPSTSILREPNTPGRSYTRASTDGTRPPPKGCSPFFVLTQINKYASDLQTSEAAVEDAQRFIASETERQKGIRENLAYVVTQAHRRQLQDGLLDAVSFQRDDVNKLLVIELKNHPRLQLAGGRPVSYRLRCDERVFDQWNRDKVKKNKSTDEVDKDSLREQQDGEKEDHQNGMEIEEAPGVDVVTEGVSAMEVEDPTPSIPADAGPTEEDYVDSEDDDDEEQDDEVEASCTHAGRPSFASRSFEAAEVKKELRVIKKALEEATKPSEVANLTQFKNAYSELLRAAEKNGGMIKGGVVLLIDKCAKCDLSVRDGTADPTRGLAYVHRRITSEIEAHCTATVHYAVACMSMAFVCGLKDGTATDINKKYGQCEVSYEAKVETLTSLRKIFEHKPNSLVPVFALPIGGAHTRNVAKTIYCSYPGGVAFAELMVSYHISQFCCTRIYAYENLVILQMQQMQRAAKALSSALAAIFGFHVLNPPSANSLFLKLFANDPRQPLVIDGILELNDEEKIIHERNRKVRIARKVRAKINVDTSATVRRTNAAVAAGLPSSTMRRKRQSDVRPGLVYHSIVPIDGSEHANLIEFGKIFFERKETRSITFTNIGKVPGLNVEIRVRSRLWKKIAERDGVIVSAVAPKNNLRSAFAPVELENNVMIALARNIKATTGWIDEDSANGVLV